MKAAIALIRAERRATDAATARVQARIARLQQHHDTGPSKKA